MSRVPDVSLTDLTFDLRPSRREDVPLEPIVRSATARLSDAALGKAVVAALAKVKDRLPVEAELVSALFTPTGAEIQVKVGTGLLSATVSIDLAARGDGKGGVIAEISDLRGLGLGLQGILGPFIHRVLEAAAQPGVVHESKGGHRLAISPNEVLASQGIPLEFDPKGVWEITAGEGHVEAVFALHREKRAGSGRRKSDTRRRPSSEEE